MTDLPRRLLVPAALVAAISTTDVVRAGDRQSYPGAYCNTNTPSDVRVAIDGRVENAVAGGREIICPILRDNVASAASPNIARIYLYDNTPTANIACDLSSRSPGGAQTDIESVTSSGSSGAVTEFAFTMPINVSPGGYYFIKCLLPGVAAGKRSGVSHYLLDEV